MARAGVEVTGVAVALVLVVIAIVISRVQRLGLEMEIVVAAIRTLVQLSVLALIIAAVFESLSYSGLFLVVMLGGRCVDVWAPFGSGSARSPGRGLSDRGRGGQWIAGSFRWTRLPARAALVDPDRRHVDR
jgi:hypothetical protein